MSNTKEKFKKIYNGSITIWIDLLYLLCSERYLTITK